VVLALVVSIASLALATTASFPDVPASHPYYTAITDLASRGIIGGYTNGNFGPNDLVKRQQFAKMIVLALGLEVKENDFPILAAPFVDLGPDDGYSLYPHEYVAVCARNNITQGTDPTHFSPLNNISRAQLITMVVRAADNLAPGTLSSPPVGWTGQLPYSDPTHGGNIKKAEYNGLLAGIQGSGSTLAGWNTAGDATRGEVAQVLHNLLGKLTPATTTTTSASTTTTATSTTTTTIVTGGLYHKWGTTAEVSGLRITVQKPWEDTYYYVLGSSIPMRVMAAHVFVENISCDKIWLDTDEFMLYDSSGVGHQAFNPGDYEPHCQPLITWLGYSRGSKFDGYIFFMVPKDQEVSRIELFSSVSFSTAAVLAIWQD
jgi:hypothetical protein